MVSFLPWATVTDIVNFPMKTSKFEQKYYSTFIDFMGVCDQDRRVVNISIMCRLLLSHRKKMAQREAPRLWSLQFCPPDDSERDGAPITNPYSSCPITFIYGKCKSMFPLINKNS